MAPHGHGGQSRRKYFCTASLGGEGGREESEGRRKGGKGGDMRGRVREKGEKREKKGKGGEERKGGRREGEGEREKWEVVKNWVIMNEGK